MWLYLSLSLPRVHGLYTVISEKRKSERESLRERASIGTTVHNGGSRASKGEKAPEPDNNRRLKLLQVLSLRLSHTLRFRLNPSLAAVLT